jgi:signal transduction histidine kinase
MSSDVLGETGRITERARPDLAVRRAAQQARAPGVSDWACRVLASTNEAIIRASDRQEMYADVCEILVRDGGYAAAWIEEVEAGSTLRPAARASWDQPGRRRQASLQVPLRHDGRLVAVLSLDQRRAETPGDRDETDRFGASDEDVTDLLRRVAANLSFALGTLAAAERMRELAIQQRKLVHGVVSAEQRERVRIANDIHDESVPLLAALELRLSVLGQSDAAADPAVRTTLDEMQTTLTRAVTGLRDLLFELDDDGADDLLEAMREAADQILLPCGVTWELAVDGEVQLPRLERLQVLRVLKEALVNVRKHARARSVRIAVRGRPDGVEVSVADDGVGLPGTLVRRPGHRGLSSMRHRAEVSGGWLQVEPGAGGGTTVRFAVPVTTAELDEV